MLALPCLQLVQIPKWGNFCDSLDFEGVHRDAVLRNNEPKEASDRNAKDTLEGVQEDIVLVTSLKNDA
jgi:hypothetical protein